MDDLFEVIKVEELFNFDAGFLSTAQTVRRALRIRHLEGMDRLLFQTRITFIDFNFP